MSVNFYCSELDKSGARCEAQCTKCHNVDHPKCGDEPEDYVSKAYLLNVDVVKDPSKADEAVKKGEGIVIQSFKFGQPVSGTLHEKEYDRTMTYDFSQPTGYCENELNFLQAMRNAPFGFYNIHTREMFMSEKTRNECALEEAVNQENYELAQEIKNDIDDYNKKANKNRQETIDQIVKRIKDLKP